jgi:hypothetical protein
MLRAGGSSVRPAILAFLAGLLLVAEPGPAGAQSIVIDTPVRAGKLILFPKVRDEKVYYYAPIQPHLANDENGRPQFSFLRYVSVTEGSGDKDAAKEGEGGGIVHALVTLSVTPEDLQEAQRELDRLKPGAKIEGPVIYKSGTFGLVSAFANKQGDLTKQVVGLGRAPVLDGAKAAVSIQLTKLGAKILWESFQTPTPDISFSFDMELEGYLSPKQATIEAEWDRVYEHQSFNAAIAGQLGPVMLAAEINQAFDELRESRAIRVTQVGDDKQMETLITTTYNKLIEQMFQPLSGTSASDLASLGGGAGKQSLLDKATTAYNQRRKEVDQSNDAKHKRNEERTRKHSAAMAARDDAERLEREAGDLEKQAQQYDEGAAGAEERAAVLEASLATKTRDAEPGSEAAPAPSGGADSNTSGTGATEGTIAEKPTPSPTPSRTQAESTTASPTTAGGEGSKEKNALKVQLADVKSQAHHLRQQAKETRATSVERRHAAQQARTKATSSAADSQDPKKSGTIEEQETRPVAQLMASFQMKKVRQTGTFRLDLNKYTSATRNLRFDENIGDLRKLWGEERHFHQVNLDDPFYRQREINVAVGGLNANDFGEYLNFVTVHLRKVHGNGKETHEEVRIDRKNFNEEGNRFRMLYGWNGDDDRRKWMEYDYQTTWGFFGGHTVEEPWKTTSAQAINLASPFQPRSVTLDADPELIKKAGVRAVTVRLYYVLDGAEHVKQTTLNTLRDQLSEKIPFILPADQLQYEYEVSWKLHGNKSVATGRQKGTDAILYVDELPEGAEGT